ncbi:anti-anti-sigma factor [Micromonospora saelicesensis]|uniref:Anti-anti-sigma factor n=1 Tax=Micromonospora saelicesensis TaxID=285676 RepID=A0A1C4WRX9_9ACTN|nr:anti-anti-sigma factor [Micromonospora saelicesensis]
MSILEQPTRRYAQPPRPHAQPTRPHAQPAKPIMTLDLHNDRHAPLIVVSGEVDMSTAHLISELAEHVITRRPARLVLDLSGVTFFSAHGISALLRTQRAAESAEVTLALRAAAPCVTYLLAVTSAGINLDIPVANASR